MWQMNEQTNLITANHNPCFTQMSAKKGIETFGKKAVSAIFDKYKQMDDLRVFEPIHYRDLSQPQKSQVVNAIDLIK